MLDFAETCAFPPRVRAAVFLPNGDAIVCCWSGPPNTEPVQGPAKGTISYWKRKKSSGGYGGLGHAGVFDDY